MPEEINRLVTDAISDLLWTPSNDADANLLAEGIPADKIDCIGNIMIDSSRCCAKRSWRRIRAGACGSKARPLRSSPFTGLPTWMTERSSLSSSERWCSYRGS
jgi:hypothetical protein